MSAKTDTFICPAGHCEEMPYKPVPLVVWCEQCLNLAQFVPAVASHGNLAAPEDCGKRIAHRFTELAETISRRKNNALLPPDPQTEFQRLIVERLRRAGFPDRHIARLASMDTYGINLSLEVDAAQAMCLLWGDHGRGKTQIATAVGMLRAKRSEHTRYITGTEFIRTIKDSFNKVPEHVVLRRFRECQCLIIDDVHAALDDDPAAVRWARGQLQDLTDARYRSESKKTLLIANAPDSSALAYRLGANIVSRIGEDGRIFHVNSKNYRQPESRPPRE